MITAVQMIFIIIGIFFLLLSIGIGGFLLMVSIYDSTIFPFLFIPGVFFIVGVAFLIYCLTPIIKRNKIKKNGVKYWAKIYGYSENRMITINGSIAINLIVRYFDQHGSIRETILPNLFQLVKKEAFLLLIQ